MKIETKIKQYILQNFPDCIKTKKLFENFFGIFIDSKTNIWYLCCTTFNNQLIILNKAEYGNQLERLKKLFPNTNFKTGKNTYNDIEFFPESLYPVHTLIADDEYIGCGGIYEI